MKWRQLSPVSEMRSANHAKGSESKTQTGHASEFWLRGCPSDRVAQCSRRREEADASTRTARSASSRRRLRVLFGPTLKNLSLRLSALLLAGLIIQGCSLKQPSPSKQTFLLEAVRAGEARSTSSPVQLRIRNIQVAAPFEGKGFVYRTSELGYKADFYNEFLTAPRSLIAAQLQTWLGASKVFRNVLPPGSSVEASHALEANVSALYGDFREPASPKAVLAIEFFLTKEQAASGEIVFHQSYRQEVVIENRTAEALAKGWGKALGQIFTALEQELPKSKE